MISSLLHLVGLRPRVYYTLTNFRGGGGGPRPPWPPPQYANVGKTYVGTHEYIGIAPTNISRSFSNTYKKILMGSPSIQSKSRNKLNIDNVTQQFTEKKI